jgi:hypothetical protein
MDVKLDSTAELAVQDTAMASARRLRRIVAKALLS